ncbi:ACT domain-containing protein [Flagellimonas hymeniacidonis]|uniref:ACT domain-containing protein n=1 Tax=Flagellimonas hymeniacidonis TaxID=2603628 RepID=A0A5C8V1K9_9FLAO|nr:ACT domain-containing protein [Flagellimonas hymeniacidonis]TXN35221.1 ACT domain-containing protein [Flagellimonas hymeniacidonis]
MVHHFVYKFNPTSRKSAAIGETDLSELIANMEPQLNNGEYLFVPVSDSSNINRSDTIATFKEEEGTTLVLKKDSAKRLGFNTHFVASWITLNVHSSLEAIGLTAAFSTELAECGISCNVVAGYYHDHILVDWKNAKRTVGLLKRMAIQHKKTIKDKFEKK